MLWGQHASFAASSDHTVDHRFIFERAPAPCLIVLPDAPRFSVLEVSDTFLELAGAARADCTGVSLLDALARAHLLSNEADLDGVRESLERAASQRSAARARLRPRAARAAGAAPEPDRVRELVSTPVLSKQGEVHYLLLHLEGAGADASPESQRTRELAERTRELASATAELEAFSYSMSHDLRAPLRVIDGFSQALSQDYDAVLDDRGRHYLERISASAQRMSALIDDMLELSRIQRAPLRKTHVDLSALARQVLEGLERESPGRAVVIDIAPGLSVHADAHLMTVMLEKLLGNAWKFTGGTPSATIQIGLAPGAGGSTLFVADNGVGFDMAHAGRLFSPFQRLHKASEFEGTGMGLAIAHRILARHGGRLWCQAEIGRGARFYFTLGGDRE